MNSEPLEADLAVTDEVINAADEIQVEYIVDEEANEREYQNTNDDPASSSICTIGTKVKAKKVRNIPKREFRWIWLDVEGFKQWLHLDVKKRNTVFCKICKIELVAMFGCLKRHARSASHYMKCGLNEPPPLKDFVIPLRKDSKQEKIRAEAELKIIGMCTAMNIAYRNVPNIVKTIKSTDRESEIWSRIKIGKTKARNIAVNVIGEEERRSLTSVLKDTYFAILVDESTDRSKYKGLAINLRFADPATGKVEYKLWDIVRIFEAGKEAKATSQRLFDVICQSFTERSVPLDNIFACCFDGCSTMVGHKSGLKALLEREIPGIICVRCPAHSTHLCATHSLSEIPKEIMTLISNIHTMLNSPNRQHNFENLQAEISIVKHKITKMCPTRWLSLESSCDRIIEEYDPLHMFAEQLAQRNDSVGKEVYNLLNAVETKCILLLIRSVLTELNALNKLFQREDVIVHRANAEIEKRYKKIVSKILNHEYVINTPASLIDVFDESKYLAFNEFEIDAEVTFYLNENGDDLERFCKIAYNFIISVALEMKERFNNFRDRLYLGIQCLDPANATSIKFREDNPNAFGTLLIKFKKLAGDEESVKVLKNQWELLPYINIPKELTAFRRRIEEMWSYLLNNIEEVSYLARFALFVLCTPHANAGPERTFSAQNLCKTKNRSKMEVETVGATLRSKQAVQMNPDSILEPTTQMVNELLNRRYYKNKYAERKLL